MVHQYQQYYSGGPPTSGDEECLYWIRFLTYHMAKANLSQVKHTHIRYIEKINTFLKANLKHVV